MTDQHTVTTTTSWGQHIVRSILAMVFGVILFLAAFPVLILNEGNLVWMGKALEEGRANVIEVDSDTPLPANNEKLVQFSGRAVTATILTDPDFPQVTVQALQLSRHVEMYQWQERSESEERSKLGGGSETVTTYTYEKIWSSEPLDSSYFSKPEGHENPRSFPYDSRLLLADPVTVGSFTLPEQLVKQLEADRPYPVTSEMAKEGIAIVNGGYYLGQNPATPQVGDLRIHYTIAPEQVVSVMGQQKGTNLRTYVTSSGESLLMIQPQSLSAAEMFLRAQADLEMDTWLIRLLGFGMMFFGIVLFLAPAGAVARVVPFLEHLATAGSFLVALVLSLPLSLLTIGLAWLFFRPLIGLTVLVVAVVIPFVLFPFIRRRMKEQRA